MEPQTLPIDVAREHLRVAFRLTPREALRAWSVERLSGGLTNDNLLWKPRAAVVVSDSAAAAGVDRLDDDDDDGDDDDDDDDEQDDDEQDDRGSSRVAAPRQKLHGRHHDHRLNLPHHDHPRHDARRAERDSKMDQDSTSASLSVSASANVTTKTKGHAGVVQPHHEPNVDVDGARAHDSAPAAALTAAPSPAPAPSRRPTPPTILPPALVLRRFHPATTKSLAIDRRAEADNTHLAYRMGVAPRVLAIIPPCDDDDDDDEENEEVGDRGREEEEEEGEDDDDDDEDEGERRRGEDGPCEGATRERGSGSGSGSGSGRGGEPNGRKDGSAAAAGAAASQNGVGPTPSSSAPRPVRHAGGLAIEFVRGRTMDDGRMRRVCESRLGAERVARAIWRLHAGVESARGRRRRGDGGGEGPREEEEEQEEGRQDKPEHEGERKGDAQGLVDGSASRDEATVRQNGRSPLERAQRQARRSSSSSPRRRLRFANEWNPRRQRDEYMRRCAELGLSLPEGLEALTPTVERLQRLLLDEAPEEHVNCHNDLLAANFIERDDEDGDDWAGEVDEEEGEEDEGDDADGLRKFLSDDDDDDDDDDGGHRSDAPAPPRAHRGRGAAEDEGRGGRIAIIDFEFSGRGAPSWELANMACETALSGRQLRRLLWAYWRRELRWRRGGGRRGAERARSGGPLGGGVGRDDDDDEAETLRRLVAAKEARTLLWGSVARLLWVVWAALVEHAKRCHPALAAEEREHLLAQRRRRRRGERSEGQSGGGEAPGRRQRGGGGRDAVDAGEEPGKEVERADGGREDAPESEEKDEEDDEADEEEDESEDEEEEEGLFDYAQWAAERLEAARRFLADTERVERLEEAVRRAWRAGDETPWPSSSVGRTETERAGLEDAGRA